MWHVYILQCSDDTLYTGSTNNLTERVATHNGETAGKRGAKYTSSRRPVQLVYSETAAGRSAALKREWEIKQLSRAEKQHLVYRAQKNG